MKVRLREIRRNKKMSGVKVAECLGISPQYYYDLERGERSLSSELAVKISELFKTTTDYLLGITENNLYDLTLSAQQKKPMKRLESIKERFNQYDFVHSYIDDNSCNQEWDEAHKAMGYLLQRLEKYEEALKYYEQCDLVITSHNCDNGNRAREALKE
jgi:transcriptional regulator with XRE-family HTH domain